MQAYLDRNFILAESKIESVNESINKTKSRSPNLEKFVIEKKYNDPSIEIQNENQVHLIDKLSEGDEDFDEENLNFFKEFINNNQNHPIKDKVEKILNIFNSDTISNKKMKITNRAKNEILRNLKLEYVTKLDELTSKIIL